MGKKNFWSGILSGIIYLLLPTHMYAHEAYVLTRQEFQRGLLSVAPNPVESLLDFSHWKISLLITIAIIINYGLIELWATTELEKKLDTFVRKAHIIGPLVIRLAISASFFYAAFANAILGPELSLNGVVGGEVIRFLLIFLSLMILVGLYTEVAALIGICIFLYMVSYYGDYMITYANYFGELVALFLFGSRFLSFDRLFFGKKLWIGLLEKYKSFEISLVRILYGSALLYAGYTIKFQHEILTVWVYNEYHLNNFFHASASYIASGAGLSEMLIGFLIFIGLGMRFTILISLVFITLSLLYFHELIWPHLMLYGISFSLLINSADILTVDRYFVPVLRGIRKKVWRTIGTLLR
jgi:uncharacterized membrane protein YphA (DoxX/SURF4 family)